jgi:DCC1-like thiol-disulfide oxidoreductase
MTTAVVSAVPWVFAFSMQAEQSIVVDPKSPGGVDSPHGLTLFDGVCVLCSRGCGFVSKRDRRGYFRFVPMQLAEGRPLADQLGINPDRPDSFAFVANGQHREPPRNCRTRAPGAGWLRPGMTKEAALPPLMAAFQPSKRRSGWARLCRAVQLPALFLRVARQRWVAAKF